MLHLRNFCQGSIVGVRQEMKGSAVKVPFSTGTVNGVGRKLETLELRTPCEKFLATPLKSDDFTSVACVVTY